MNLPKKFLLLLAGAAAVLAGCGSVGRTENIFTVLEQTESSGEADAGGKTGAAGGASSAGAASPVYLHLVHSSSENSAIDRTADRFRDLVEEYSQGNIKVEVFANDSMGYIYDYPEALREGTVDAWIGSGTKIAQAVSWLPTIRGLSLEQVKAVLADSRVQEAYSAEAENGGYRIMAAFPLQYRVLTANIPVRTVEDLRKLKMRCYAEQSGETAYWGALGVPTAVYDVHQLYSALQQHLVTAQANTLPVIVSTQIYNQQRYVIETKHMVYQDMLCVSSNFYRSLTPEQQEILDRAARELGDFSEEVYSAEIVRSQRILENAGLRTISADEQLISDMRRIGGPAAERELREIYGDEKINLVMNAPVS